MKGNNMRLHTKLTKSLVQTFSKFSGVSETSVFHTNHSKSNNNIQNLKGYNDIPGPSQVPFFGSFFDLKFLPFGGQSDVTDYRQFQIDLQQRYGDIVKWKLLLGKEVFLFNPEHLKTIFQREKFFKIPERPLLEPMVLVQKEIGVSPGLLVR